MVDVNIYNHIIDTLNFGFTVKSYLANPAYFFHLAAKLVSHTYI